MSKIDIGDIIEVDGGMFNREIDWDKSQSNLDKAFQSQSLAHQTEINTHLDTISTLQQENKKDLLAMNKEMEDVVVGMLDLAEDFDMRPEAYFMFKAKVEEIAQKHNINIK